MDSLLMGITVIALALAIVLSALAWRLLRENRMRSAARAETLQALAASSVAAEDRFVALEEEEEEHAAGEGNAWDLRLRTTSGNDERERAAGPEVPGRAFHSGGSRRWLALVAAGLLIAALITLYPRYAPGGAAGSLLNTLAPALRGAGGSPLELLSLHHSTTDGGFTVTGLVQNPAGGTAVRDVLAVVYLFDRDGNYFASGKAPLDFGLLEPGGESPFSVRLPTVSSVGRYRVGFRLEGGGVIAHVDRRGYPPAGTTGEALNGAPVPPRAAAAWGGEGR